MFNTPTSFITIQVVVYMKKRLLAYYQKLFFCLFCYCKANYTNYLCEKREPFGRKGSKRFRFFVVATYTSLPIILSFGVNSKQCITGYNKYICGGEIKYVLKNCTSMITLLICTLTSISQK